MNIIERQKIFQKHYKMYYKILVMYALRLVDDSDSAEDIVQEVFGNVWEHRLDFGSDDSMRLYLYAAVRNSCLNQNKHKTITDGYANSMRNAADIYSIGEGVDDEVVERAEVLRRVMQLIDSMPTKQREVFLRLMEGKKLREIADELHVSESTVKAQKYRGLAMIKSQLGKDTLALLLLIAILEMEANR